MSNKPLVSVIIPFLNAEKFVQEAMESVFGQTYENWELLLVDDGSTDGSTQIAHHYVEQFPGKVRYLEHPEHQNRGAAASRNLGVDHANGEYIALLDADDAWFAFKLERQVAILNSHPEAGMLFGLSQYWHSWTGAPEDAHCDFVPELGVQADTLFEPSTLLTLLDPLGRATSPCPSNLLLRREVMERTARFEESFTGMYQLYEDQVFLVKVYLKEAVFVANECWDRYRIHPEQCVSVTQRAGQQQSIRLFFLHWLEEYLSGQGVKDTEVWRLLQEKQLLARVRVHVEKREWKQAMRNLLVLLWHHPLAFVRVYQKLRLRQRRRYLPPS
jgi:glycosyltransferase involved in cell wall biosynthesis